MDLHAHTFDFTLQLLAAHIIQLFGHQHGRKFDDVGFHAEVFQRAGGFEAQQAAADDGAAFAATCAGFNRVQIFNGAVNKAVLSFRAFDWRDPRIGARRHHQLVVKYGASRAGVNHFLLAVNGNSAFTDQDFNAMFLVKTFTDQRELFGGVMGEVRRQVDAVVSDTGFFTEHGNVELSGRRLIKKLFDKAMANHAVTDNSDSDFAHFCLDFFSITAYLNDSASTLIDTNQDRPRLPLNGYAYDFPGFL
jgi:hypothetical protein